MDSDRFGNYVNGHHVKISEKKNEMHLRIFRRNYGISDHFNAATSF